MFRNMVLINSSRASPQETRQESQKQEKIYIYRTYYDNGNIETETPFLSSRLDSKNEKPKESCFQSKLGDLEHGIVKTFFPHGSIATTKSFKQGVYHGEHEVWYAENRIKYLCNYKNGVSHGEEKVYFETGKLRYLCNWENGELHGTYYEWDDKDKLVLEIKFKHGKPHGLCKR